MKMRKLLRPVHQLCPGRKGRSRRAKRVLLDLTKPVFAICAIASTAQRHPTCDCESTHTTIQV